MPPAAAPAPPPALVPVADPSAAAGADATILVATPGERGAFAAELAAAALLDAHALSSVAVLAAPTAAGGRLVFSPTGPLDRDMDDVRRVADAVARGVKRAVAAGARAPLLLLPASVTARGGAFAQALLVALVAVCDALYVPLSVRLGKPQPAVGGAVGSVFVHAAGVPAEELAAAARTARAIALGKGVAKDVGGSDPELGAPPQCAAYLQAAFAGVPGVSVSVEDDAAQIAAKYPLAGAVARASLHVPRHHPRIVRLEYHNNGSGGGGAPAQQLYLVGKGITYDTGGADIKTGGHMGGMSRDKCGAAGVAGFVRAVAELAPPGLRVVALLGFVRNSTGSDRCVCAPRGC